MSKSALEDRIRRLEDRVAISDVVIAYATSIDRGDWARYASTMTDPAHVDFSEAGLPAMDFSHEQLVGFVSQALSGWTARQHLSPNHQIVFDETDSDRATCFSYMYAQHYKQGAPGGEFYLMRGSYDNEMVRTVDGWKIARVTQHISWLEGNAAALESAAQV